MTDPSPPRPPSWPPSPAPWPAPPPSSAPAPTRAAFEPPVRAAFEPPVRRAPRATRAGLPPAAVRAGRTAASVVLVLAGLGLGARLDQWTPIDSDGFRHRTGAAESAFVVRGAVGDAVEARGYAVTVLGVRGAPTLRGRTLRAKGDLDTAGVWILVRVRLTARDRPTKVGTASLVTASGDAYDASDRYQQTVVGYRTLQPDLPAVGDVVFEVPRAVAAQALTVRLSGHRDDRLDSAVEIALPAAGEAGAAAWLRAPTATPERPA